MSTPVIKEGRVGLHLSCVFRNRPVFRMNKTRESVFSRFVCLYLYFSSPLTFDSTSVCTRPPNTDAFLDTAAGEGAEDGLLF